ncbi:uncharacterized protein BKA78DRAFT_309349 [Phyllosticta capitalensis]|uniref:uncharacterized protein n=1 Tax=Phyllosticta capitalensis TaxID=121624 RepID=UPI00313287C0
MTATRSDNPEPSSQAARATPPEPKSTTNHHGDPGSALPTDKATPSGPTQTPFSLQLVGKSSAKPSSSFPCSYTTSKLGQHSTTWLLPTATECTRGRIISRSCS